VDTFLSAGDELYRSGDLEEARAQYEKASALAESDPAVLQRLLKVETTRADVDWLRLRIIPKTSPEVATVTASLQERSTKLQRRLEELQKVIGASQAQGTLAVVDALRVQGQIAAARTLVQQTSGLSNDADSAYVSAMLDVSEVNPNWLSIVSRLKIAVSGERGLGRAQAALVYSLVSAGQLEEARQQLEVLAGFKRQNPLLADLQSMLNAAVIAPPVEARGAAASEDGAAAPGETVAPQPAKGGATVGSELWSDDPMAEAAEARASGELSRAGKLYSYALSKEPTNVAAMTGLGDVARSQGNSDIALSHYGAALRTNPNYGPAILSCADLKWSMGDRAAAVDLYRRLGAGAPHRVGDRIAEFEKGTAQTEPPQASVSPNPEPAPTPHEPIGGAPGPASEPAAPEPQQGTP
jgi:tetratricopeptide (TPR) repeat protein